MAQHNKLQDGHPGEYYLLRPDVARGGSVIVSFAMRSWMQVYPALGDQMAFGSRTSPTSEI